MLQEYTTVSPKEFAQEIKSSNVYLIDVRKADEYAEEHIEGAHNLDVTSEDFISRAEKGLPRNKTIATYCGTGKRSGIAADELTKAGFKILNLDGGLGAWKSEGLPVVK